MEAPYRIPRNNIWIYLALTIAGICILILHKLDDPLTPAIGSDRMMIFGVLIIMTGYLPIVGKVFNQSIWQATVPADSKRFILLILFSIFLIAVSQGIYRQSDNILWLIIAMVSIAGAAISFNNFHKIG